MSLPLPPTALTEWTQTYLSKRLIYALSGFHRTLADDLDALSLSSPNTLPRGQKRCYLAPRGSAKTTWATWAYPIREALEGREPYICIVSDTQPNAVKFLAHIAYEIEANQGLLRDYPYSAGRGPVWRQDSIKLRNGVIIEALSTGEAIRGRIGEVHRPTLIIADDLQNRDTIVSPTLRQRDWDWFQADLLRLGEPGTNIVVLGTAIHRECIVCRLATSPGWSVRTYRSVESMPSRSDLWREWETILHDYQDDDRLMKAKAFYINHPEMNDGAAVLWPEREPLYDLMLVRAQGEGAFLSEHQNNPTDPNACEWPSYYFDSPTFWFDTWPSNLQVRVIFLDPSKGRSDKVGDYSAFIMYGREANGWEYVEADLRRLNVDEIAHTACEHVLRFQPETFGLEAEAWQELLSIPIKNAAIVRNMNFPILGINQAGVPKPVRIRRLTQPLAERRIRFKSRSPGTQILVDQLKEFPTGSHDDGPDALEGARRLAIQLVNGRTQ